MATFRPCMSSRRAKPAEMSAGSGKGVNLKPTIVAYDGMAVIVNSGNPLKGLYAGNPQRATARLGFTAAINFSDGMREFRSSPLRTVSGPRPTMS